MQSSAWLSEETGAEVHFKLECGQLTGSFKLRGVANRLLAMDPAERARGIVAASTGNHGAAVAHVAAALGCPARVFAPHGADPSKLAAIRAAGAGIEMCGSDCLDAERAARAAAAAAGEVYLSPYNDPLVVAGQGTVGLELHEQLARCDGVFVAVGGGGLIAGVAGFLKSVRPGLRVVGCSPAASAVMARSVAAGRVLDLPSAPTWSDATAGGLEEGSLTFPLCRQSVDQWVEVSEPEILAAVREVERRDGLRIEGAAGVAVAGLRRTAAAWPGAAVAVVLCGGNRSAALGRALA